MTMDNEKVLEVKNLYDKVLSEPSFLIYQQQMLINEAKRTIRMMELYKQTNILFMESDKEKGMSTNRAIINAQNEITLRENYIEYLESLEEEDLQKENAMALKTDALKHYINRLKFTNEIISEPDLIVVSDNTTGINNT